MKVLDITERLDEVNKLLKSTFYIPKYKYLHSQGYFEPLDIVLRNWNNQGFIFCDENDNIIGTISFSISRPTNELNIYTLALFTEEYKYKKFIYNELVKWFDKVLSESYYNKISFGVVVGNHIEKAYDKITKRYNGKVVGIHENECILNDGKYYDLKRYEIINTNFSRIRGLDNLKGGSINVRR